jgi:hypothetical protein
MMQGIKATFVVVLAAAAIACGGGSMSGAGDSVSLSLAASSLQVFQGEASQMVNATITRMGSVGSVTITVTGLPNGATAQIQSPGAGNSGSITVDPGTSAAGSYMLHVVAGDGTVSDRATLTLVIGAVVHVTNGLNGRFEVAMSTSFQPAEWAYQFFQQNPTATVSLSNLLSQHIRLQPLSQAIPQRSLLAWDFSIVDSITQPVLSVGDNSPEFQIAKAPAFMYDAAGNFNDPTFAEFATYTQQLVSYYNKGGFTSLDGQFHVSPSPHTITYWGIYNEPNFNSVSATQYWQMYNKVVPAMQAVDPSLKFVAEELGDYPSLAQMYMPAFVSNVSAQVDVLATHFYSTCNQKDSDAQLFLTVPSFVSEVNVIKSYLATNPKLAGVPIWVTENNVNADYDKGGGISACNSNAFTADKRDSSAFFAAWRPYVFSQLGKAGTKALYHWSFPGDVQYGEVDGNTARIQLSYWVDYWLARIFPSPPGSDLLLFSTTDAQDMEILPARNPDGSIVIMVANFAVASPGDNNGAGAPRTIAVDLSALKSFTSGTLLMIDAATDVVNGPAAASVTPSNRMTVTLDGYGVAFLTLK